MNKLFVIFATILVLSVVKAQNVNLDCLFDFWPDEIYTCYLNDVAVADNENLSITIGGFHWGQRGNADVLRVLISNSSIPFIITQLFTTFPNLRILGISNDRAFNRIRIGDFTDANSLTNFVVTSSLQLTNIGANVFRGASRLNDIALQQNNIDTIHEAAFEGCDQLLQLYLDHNLIRNLPENVFRSLTRLSIFSMIGNFLESLHGNLFVNNPNIVTLIFNDNRINSVSRNFLNNLNNLEVFFIERNQCIDGWWIIRNQSEREALLRALNNCFENSVETPQPEPENEVKRFILELRGTLILRNENGTEVVRI